MQILFYFIMNSNNILFEKYKNELKYTFIFPMNTVFI